MFGKRFGGGDQELPFSSQEFVQLLSYLPHVKRIELQCYPYRTHYLTLLNEHADMLLGVQEISHLGGPWTLEEQKLYNSCVVAFKDTLRCIELVNFETSTRGDGSGNMISILPKFKSLNDLKIKNLNEEFASNLPQLRMFQVMQLCTHLKRFSILNEFKEPDDDVVKSLQYKNLEYLDIDVPEIAKRHVEYIVSNIPHLKHFKLKSGYRKNDDDPRNQVQWIETLGSDNVGLLSSFLTKIDSLELCFGVNFLPDITKFWPLIRGILNERTQPLPLHLSVWIDMEALEYHKDPDSQICLKIFKNKASLHYALNKNKFSDALKIKPAADVIIPFDNSEIAPQSIVVYYTSDKKHMSYIYPMLDVIRSLRNTIPSIHYIDMRIGYSFKTPLQIKVGSEELLCDKLGVNERISDERLPPSPSSLDNRLEYVLLQHVGEKFLTAIMEQLPHTRYLKLFNYNIYKDSSFNMQMTLGPLHLRQFMFDIGPIIDKSSNRQVIVLSIEEEEPQQTRYYKWARDSYDNEYIEFEQVGIEFLKKNNRFIRPLTTILSIRCSRIEEIKICLKDSLCVRATIDLRS